MKTLFSTKILSVIFFFIFTFGINTLSAEMLNEQENIWLTTYLTDKSSRPTITTEFWENMAQQVNELRETLPDLIHPNILLVGIKYDGKVLINYTFFVNNPAVNLTNTKNILVSVFCYDPQILLFLNIFDGEFTYTYFLQRDLSRVWYKFHMDASDCKSI